MTRAPRAVLFDMDGLLVDSEPVWSVAEAEIMAWLGGPWNLDVKAACIGRRIDEACAILTTIAESPVEPAVVADRLLARVAELFATDLPVQPGALDLIDAARAAGLRTALVSSSYRLLVDAALAVLGGDRFDMTIAGDEVVLAKPDPEPYLRAAALLGVDPGDCIVLEDSLTGARSGEAAGCRVVVVPGVVPVAGRETYASLPAVQAALLGQSASR